MPSTPWSRSRTSSGLADVVEFTGRIPDEDVLRYLSTADVCLSPDPLNPLNDVSTMNKIMEYMAMARPIVSFDLREARVSAGDAAVYAAANDEREFARLIADLLDDPEAARTDGRDRPPARRKLALVGRLRTESPCSVRRTPRPVRVSCSPLSLPADRFGGKAQSEEWTPVVEESNAAT